MLGKSINDPQGLEGLAGTSEGFGWLNIETELLAEKTLKNVTGKLILPNQAPCDIQGYEIHAGLTLKSSKDSIQKDLASSENTSIITTDDNHICALLSADEQIMASYWHGLMDTPQALQSILRWAGAETQLIDYQELREKSLDVLGDSVEQHLDWQKLESALNEFSEKR